MINATADPSVATGNHPRRWAEAVANEVDIMDMKIEKCPPRIGGIQEVAVAPTGCLSDPSEARTEDATVGIGRDSCF